jgi:hypothetical protein
VVVGSALVTVRLDAADVDPANWEDPEYVAVTEYPDGFSLVAVGEQVAELPERRAVHRTVVPAPTVTVPVGVPPPLAAVVTWNDSACSSP